mgnify:CR=1 FL=1
MMKFAFGPEAVVRGTCQSNLPQVNYYHATALQPWHFHSRFVTKALHCTRHFDTCSRQLSTIHRSKFVAANPKRKTGVNDPCKSARWPIDHYQVSVSVKLPTPTDRFAFGHYQTEEINPFGYPISTKLNWSSLENDVVMGLIRHSPDLWNIY